MKQNKMFLLSMIIVIIALVVMLISRFFTFSDWIIRIDGIIMLIGIFALSYNTVKFYSHKQ